MVKERESAPWPGNYTLSVRDTEDVAHYQIKQSLDNGNFFISTRATFETIVDLVNYYQEQADGLCANLIRPCASSEEQAEWEIDRRQIRFIMKLGEGQFCHEWRALWNGRNPVGVKSLKPESMSTCKFLQVASLMKKLHHRNIIQLYGMSTKEEPIFIVIEYMMHGTLLEYLHGDGKSLDFPHLIDMSTQVASGMAYLEKQNYMHRDLAAKNVLVGENLLCKVANFELARVVDKEVYEDQAKELIAMKWTAPEAIQYNRFSTKSDVWSFGIMLYEIITYGCIPYPNMTNDQVHKQLQQGYHMPCPMGCPEKLYYIMLDCWRKEPANRPTFYTLKWQLEEYFNDKGMRVYMSV